MPINLNKDYNGNAINDGTFVYDSGYDKKPNNAHGVLLTAIPPKLVKIAIACIIFAAIVAYASSMAKGAQEPLFRTVYSYSPSKGVTHSVIRDMEIGTEYIVFETKNGVAICTRVTPLDGKPFTTSKYTGEGVAK